MKMLLCAFWQFLVAKLGRKELPSFTVNLDDSEAKWESEAIEEWDLAFESATGKLPPFSQLEAQRKVAADVQAIEQLRANRKNTHAFAKFEGVRVVDGKTGFTLQKNYFGRDLEAFNDMVKEDYQRHIIVAHNVVLPSEEIASFQAGEVIRVQSSADIRARQVQRRYDDLLRAKGIDPEHYQGIVSSRQL